jgi:predicted P-loop ATPase
VSVPCPFAQYSGCSVNTDSFELTGQSGCEQKLAQFGLINLDEYDRLSPQKLPLLKTLMQMKKLDFRKSHRSSYSHLPRMASFIGTSNHKDLLTDPTGSRRYLCAEVKEKIDCTPLEHKQLFAQLKAELEGGERYWFSAEEEAELQLRNREFYAMPFRQSVHQFRIHNSDGGNIVRVYTNHLLMVFLIRDDIVDSHLGGSTGGSGQCNDRH